MVKLSRFETAVVVTTAAAGLGVAASAALASSLDFEEKKPIASEPAPMSFEEFELRWPTLPASRGEFLDAWAYGYVQSKGALSKVFRFAGQMFVAPIAMATIDALYEMYVDYVEACPKSSVNMSKLVSRKQ